MSSSTHRRYGLIGQTLDYSFSKGYFTEKFKREGIDAVYENHEWATIEEFNTIDRDTLNGLNVTIPYKEAILPYLDVLDAEAEEIGAVNTIRFVDGLTIGHNTDVYGFRESLRPFLKSHHQKALILGTGGASKAVAYVLRQMGLEFRFVSRTPSAKKEIGYEELNAQALRIFPFIINTTPLGTAPAENECVDIPYAALDEKNFLYDLIYNPEETSFLRAGREAGSQTMNGRRMLELQAEKSWKIWTEDPSITIK